MAGRAHERPGLENRVYLISPSGWTNIISGVVFFFFYLQSFRIRQNKTYLNHIYLISY